MFGGGGVGVGGLSLKISSLFFQITAKNFNRRQDMLQKDTETKGYLCTLFYKNLVCLQVGFGVYAVVFLFCKRKAERGYEHHL